MVSRGPSGRIIVKKLDDMINARSIFYRVGLPFLSMHLVIMVFFGSLIVRYLLRGMAPPLFTSLYLLTQVADHVECHVPM